jgi:lysophospholipase L1-like esterase
MLALGDSYTIGEGVEEGDRWPVQLARTLRAAGIDVDTPHIVAQTGWTAAELSRAMRERRVTGAFELVTLLIGVNNQYRGMIVGAYRGQFRGLLTNAIELAHATPSRVIVVSIPDWGVTRFNSRRDPARVAREIDAYNRANREEAVAAGADWVDITDLTRAAPAAVVADGLHPNAAMYASWVERIAPVARRILTATARA